MGRTIRKEGNKMAFPWFVGSGKRSITIDTLYNYCQTAQQTLFPTEDYDFWLPYEANYQKFDRYFKQKYRAFKVCQEYSADASLEGMLTDWKSIVDAFLFLNSKRYSELYKVQVLAADAYDVVNNYDLHETIQRLNTGTVRDNLGARTDSATTGAQTHATEYGATQETLQAGQATDSTQYGQAQRTDVIGATRDTNSSAIGAQTSTNTQTRSAFNSSSLQDVAGGSINNGARSDSSIVSSDAHTDTHTDAGRTDTTTRGSHTDTTSQAAHTDTLTDGARTDGHTQGAQENLRTDNLAENTTVRRYGNIGVQTPADVIGGHIDLWRAFRFYQMIFDEIAEEYLVIDVDFDFESSNVSGGGGGGDAELLAAIRALSAQLTAAQADINGNVDTEAAGIKTAIRGDISTLSTKLTADTASIRADLVTVMSNEDANAFEIKDEIRTATTSVRADITRSIANDDTNAYEIQEDIRTATATIRGDILEVLTNGY